jgi:hypothetical protein
VVEAVGVTVGTALWYSNEPMSQMVDPLLSPSTGRAAPR